MSDLTFDKICEMEPRVLEKFNEMIKNETHRSAAFSNYCAVRRWEDGGGTGFRGYKFAVSLLVGKKRHRAKNEVLESEEAFEIVKSAFLDAMPPCKDVIHNSLGKPEE